MERAPGSIRLCVLAPTRERERAHLYNRRSHPPACHSIPPFSPLGPDKSRKAFAIHTTGEDRSVWASAIKIWAPKSLAIIRTSCYGGLFSPVNGGLWSCRRRSYPPRWHLPSAKCSQDRWPGNSPVWACHRWANPAARPCVSHRIIIIMQQNQKKEYGVGGSYLRRRMPSSKLGTVNRCKCSANLLSVFRA